MFTASRTGSEYDCPPRPGANRNRRDEEKVPWCGVDHVYNQGCDLLVSVGNLFSVNAE